MKIATTKPIRKNQTGGFYINGQSLAEMSDSFSSPIGTIKRRLHTARNRLRDVMGDFQPV